MSYITRFTDTAGGHWGCAWLLCLTCGVSPCSFSCCRHSSGVEAFYHAIPGIGESCAKVIAAAYPSIRALARKYKEVAANSPDGQDSRESVRLLENLVYQGSSTSSRKSQRLGPKRSERIHLLFHSRDPMCAISTLCCDVAASAPP